MLEVATEEFLLAAVILAIELYLSEAEQVKQNVVIN